MVNSPLIEKVSGCCVPNGLLVVWAQITGYTLRGAEQVSKVLVLWIKYVIELLGLSLHRRLIPFPLSPSHVSRFNFKVVHGFIRTGSDGLSEVKLILVLYRLFLFIYIKLNILRRFIIVWMLLPYVFLGVVVWWFMRQFCWFRHRLCEFPLPESAGYFATPESKAGSQALGHH